MGAAEDLDRAKPTLPPAPCKPPKPPRSTTSLPFSPSATVWRWLGATTLAGRSDLAEFVQSLSARQAVLVRVDLPGGESLAAPPAGARVVALSGKSADAKFLSPTADVDPQIQGQGFIFPSSLTPSRWPRASRLQSGCKCRATR